MVKTFKTSVSLVVMMILTVLLSACTSKKVQPLSSKYLEFSTCYNIFPIAFADSDGDGKGDLRGIIEQLDYLNDGDDETDEDLGIDCIWLNPIHPSPTYHKYDVIDYYAIDPDFGTLDDFKELIEEAHKRGIAVIIDFVINHTSSEHEWFKKAKSGEKKYRNWYRWRKASDDSYSTLEGWVRAGDEYYFASFWSEMPELNFENKQVRQEIKRIAKYWLDFGVDGFRIDAAFHVYDNREYPIETDVLTKNIEWFKEFNAYVKKINKDAIIISEIWQDMRTVSHFLPGMDAAFNFDLAESIVSGVNSRNTKNLSSVIERTQKTYHEARPGFYDSIFLTNHDQNRVMSRLNGNMEQAKLAAHVLFTLPGVSWVYYGEEIGMFGVKPDEQIREPFIWKEDRTALPNTRWVTSLYNTETPALETQKEAPDSLFNTYRTLIHLKKNDLVLRKGDINVLSAPITALAFTRSYNEQTYLVIHNFSRLDKTFTLDGAMSNIIYQSHEENKVEGQDIHMVSSSTFIIEVTGSVTIDG